MLRAHPVRTIPPYMKRPYDSHLMKRHSSTVISSNEKFLEELGHERKQRVELEESHKKVWEYNRQLVSELNSVEAENKVLKGKLQEVELRESVLSLRINEIIRDMDLLDDRGAPYTLTRDDYIPRIRRWSEELRQLINQHAPKV